MLRRPRYLAVMAGFAFGLAGCQTQATVEREPHVGATTATPGSDGVQRVLVTTDDRWRFDPSQITVHPGQVRITLKHSGTGAPHDWQLSGFAADYVPLVQGGQQNSVQFTAPAPGTYQFVCSIHADRGQTGDLVVLPN